MTSRSKQVAVGKAVQALEKLTDEARAFWILHDPTASDRWRAASAELARARADIAKDEK